MGINATVVYDITRHTTLVLRTVSSSPKTRHQIHDTVASFSQHCESLRGLANSSTEVCALWGGPPFVSYALVHSRFRVIVIWHEHPSDVNIAYDVCHAVVRLERAVNAVADALIKSETSAISTVYDEAGYALRGDDAIIIPSSDPTKSSARSKLLPIVSLPPRRSSVATSQRDKKKTIATPKFFGRIGAALKTATALGDSARSARSKSRHPTRQTHHDPSQPNFGPDGAFDDAEGPLALPDDVFLWCHFGTPLPDHAGNLDWFHHLFGTTAPTATGNSLSPSNHSSVLPALRAGSTPSTLLTIPSASTPLVLNQSASPHSGSAPNVSGADQSISSKAVLSHGNGTGVPSSDEIASNSQPDGSAVNVPVPASMSSASAAVNSQQTPSVQNTSQQVTPSQSASQQASAQQTPALTPASMLQQPFQTQPFQHGQEQQQQVQQPKQPSVQQVMEESGISTDPDRKIGDFDVSHLGTVKDAGTEAAHMKYNSGTVTPEENKSTDDSIRARMNEFANTMQSGNFPLALQQVYGALRYLCRIEPRRDREIVTCSNYVLAQKILMRNAVLEGELAQCVAGTPDAVRRQVESALLAMFLAELKHLLPRHRVAAMRIAVEKNIAVGNFGMAARWLRQLVEKAPPNQKTVISNQMQTCTSNGELNAHMPPTNRLCFATLQVVTSPFGKCDVCSALYHATLSGVVDGQACDTCYIGSIHARS